MANKGVPKCRLKIRLGHGHLRNSLFWFPELLFSEPVCNRNAWDCIWPEQGIVCWMFCVVFTKIGLSGLSQDYFLGQAWPGMTNVCHKFNDILNM